MTLGKVLPHGVVRRCVLVSMVSLAALAAGGPASGGPLGTKSVQVLGLCSGGGQLCNDIPAFAYHVGGNGGLRMAKFVSNGPAACSAVRIHFLVDGTEVAVTGFVGPGDDTGPISLGFIGPGGHTIGVQAEGEVGGCNVGNLISWTGLVAVWKHP